MGKVDAGSLDEEEGLLAFSGDLMTAWKVSPSANLRVSRGVSSLRIFPE